MRKKGTVLHYVPYLANGGIEQMILSFYAKIKNKYEFIVVYNDYASTACEKRFQKAGIKTYKIAHWQHGYAKNNHDLRKVIDIVKPDIFECHHGIYSIFGLLAAKQAGIKHRICHCHAYLPDKTVKQKILNILTKAVSTDYFACGEGAAEYIYGKKWRKAVTVIYNGVDINKYSFSGSKRRSKRDELGIKDQEVVLGTVGRFDKQKNTMFLLDCFSSLRKKLNNIKLLLIGGTGDLYKEVVKEIQDRNLGDSVIILKDRTDMPELYSVMDIFVLPSIFEGLPISLIEARISGLKCLVSNTIRIDHCDDDIKMLSIRDSNVWVDYIVNKKPFSNTRKRPQYIDNLFSIERCARALEMAYNKVMSAD